MDTLIYSQINGKMTKVGTPKWLARRKNFVVLYKGKDWSGFRSLDECEIQFREFENHINAHCDNFTVVERL